jgi:hypothetical protein
MYSIEETMNASDIINRYAGRYARILESNRKSYQNRYDTDIEFRLKENKRTGASIMQRYNSDPEYRQKVIDASKARYHAKKQALARDKQE